MKADTLHERLVNLLVGYKHPDNVSVKENDSFFNFVKDLLLNTDTKTRKVLLHWLKGYKELVTDGPKNCLYKDFILYIPAPRTLISQMLDHLEHLNYAQKIKAPVNYDPFSYQTHYDCLHIVTKYPLPTKPIDPNKFHYLNKVAEMFDDDDNCFTVYKFIERRTDPLYKTPKKAFITFMKSHFGKHAMPWCICDENRNCWNESRYANKYLVFKNNKLYAAAAADYGYALTLFNRINKPIATLYLPCPYPENTNYLIRFFHITKEDELTFTSTTASMFDPPVIHGCVHQNNPTDILATTPFRHLCSNEKGFQWFSYYTKVPTKKDLPSYSVILNGEYTLSSTKLIRYRVKLTVDNDKDIPLHIVTRVNVEEFRGRRVNSPAISHEYCATMTKEKAASLIEQHIKESLARTLLYTRKDIKNEKVRTDQ